MFFHAPIHKLSIPTLSVFFIFALPIGYLELQEHLHVCRVQQYPIVQGDVIRSEEIQEYGIPREKLTIRVAGQKDMVHSVLTIDEARQLGSPVRFHYSGNPAEEVPLEGESGHLWIVVFFWGMPLLLLLMYLYFRKRKKYALVIE